MNITNHLAMDTDFPIKQEPNDPRYSSPPPLMLITQSGVNETTTLKMESEMDEVEDVDISSPIALALQQSPSLSNYSHVRGEDNSSVSPPSCTDSAADIELSEKKSMERDDGGWKFLDPVKEERRDGKQRNKFPAVNFLKRLEQIVESVNSVDPSKVTIARRRSNVTVRRFGVHIKDRKYLFRGSDEFSLSSSDESYSVKEDGSSHSTETPEIHPNAIERFPLAVTPEIDREVRPLSAGRLTEQPLDLSFKTRESSCAEKNKCDAGSATSRFQGMNKLCRGSNDDTEMTQVVNHSGSLILNSLTFSGASLSARCTRIGESPREKNDAGFKSYLNSSVSNGRGDAMNSEKAKVRQTNANDDPYKKRNFQSHLSPSQYFHESGGVYDRTVTVISRDKVLGTSQLSVATPKLVCSFTKQQQPLASHWKTHCDSHKDTPITLSPTKLRRKEFSKITTNGLNDYNGFCINGERDTRDVNDAKSNLLRCVECCKLFRTLQQLTIHMMSSGHYMNLIGGASFYHRNYCNARSIEPLFTAAPSLSGCVDRPSAVTSIDEGNLQKFDYVNRRTNGHSITSPLRLKSRISRKRKRTDKEVREGWMATEITSPIETKALGCSETSSANSSPLSRSSLSSVDSRASAIDPIERIDESHALIRCPIKRQANNSQIAEIGSRTNSCTKESFLSIASLIDDKYSGSGFCRRYDGHETVKCERKSQEKLVLEDSYSLILSKDASKSFRKGEFKICENATALTSIIGNEGGGREGALRPMNWMKYETELLHKLGRCFNYPDHPTSKTEVEKSTENIPRVYDTNHHFSATPHAHSPTTTSVADDSIGSKYIQISSEELLSNSNVSALDSLHRLVFGDTISNGSRYTGNTTRLCQKDHVNGHHQLSSDSNVKVQKTRIRNDSFGSKTLQSNATLQLDYPRQLSRPSSSDEQQCQSVSGDKHGASLILDCVSSPKQIDIRSTPQRTGPSLSGGVCERNGPSSTGGVCEQNGSSFIGGGVWERTGSSSIGGDVCERTDSSSTGGVCESLTSPNLDRSSVTDAAEENSRNAPASLIVSMIKNEGSKTSISTGSGSPDKSPISPSRAQDGPTSNRPSSQLRTRDANHFSCESEKCSESDEVCVDKSEKLENMRKRSMLDSSRNEKASEKKRIYIENIPNCECLETVQNHHRRDPAYGGCQSKSPVAAVIAKQLNFPTALDLINIRPENDRPSECLVNQGRTKTERLWRPDNFETEDRFSKYYRLATELMSKTI